MPKQAGVMAVASIDNIRVIHATECAASGTLSVLVALVHELSSAGARQLIIYSEREETPRDIEKLFPAGVEFVKIPSARGLHIAFVRDFCRALTAGMRTWRADAVHLHSSKAGFLGRCVHAALRGPCRMFYSPHGLSFLDPDRPLRNLIFKTLEALAARTRAMPVGCSAGEAELLAKLSRKSAFVLENPVAEQFFSVSRLPAQHTTIVTVGRLSRQKAPERFAAVAREVRNHVPSVRFVWVGDGDAHYRAELLAAGCEVTGWLQREEVGAILAIADVYLQTSRWEGLPISVMEALAAGVPCIVSDCAGNRDVISQGLTGYVVSTERDMALSVLDVVRNPGLRAQLSANARSEAVRRFAPVAFGSRVRQLYGALP